MDRATALRSGILTPPALVAAIRSAGAQAALPLLRVATIPADSGAEGYYAVDMGFYKKAGLNVELAIVQNGNEMMAAAISGTYDIIQSSITAAALARERGLPFVMIAPAVVWSSKTTTSLLVVPRDSPIKSARDLAGKNVALNALANIPGVAVSAWLDQNGGDSASVKFVEIPWSTMPAALAGGRVDSAFIAEPFLDAARRTAPIRVLGAPYDAIANEFMLSAWYGTSDFVRTHADAVRRFAVANAETAIWANRNHPESGRILEKYAKTAVPSTMVRAVYAERLDAALVQPVLDISFKYKLLHAPALAKDMIAP